MCRFSLHKTQFIVQTVAALQHKLTCTSGIFVAMWHFSAVLPVSAISPSCLQAPYGD